jgi:hypothetical protein
VIYNKRLFNSKILFFINQQETVVNTPLIPSGLPAVRKPACKTTKKTRHPLEMLGWLYIVAAIFQAGWLSVVVSNWEIAREFINLDMALGLACAATWLGMAWCTIHLPYIGWRLVKVTRDSGLQVVQNPWEKRASRAVAYLLGVGILTDLIFFITIALFVGDQSVAVFFSFLMGVRVLGINTEAILKYHNI